MIHLKTISFGYKRRKLLFDNLSLSLEPGSIYGLLGRNGAGKTTLLKLMTGLTFPKRGDIEVWGYNPQKRQAGFLSDCFLIMEEPYFPNMRIETFATLYAPFYPKFDNQQFENLLKEFGLNAKSNFKKISMGQKKKALIAFGVATNARLLMMDEPTNALDIPSKKQFRKLIAQQISDDRIFIISTHQVRDLQSLLDGILILDQGQILFNESIASIMDTLEFRVEYTRPDASNLLFTERIAGGYYCIYPKQSDDSLEVDIEILFNAIIEDVPTFYNLFKTPHHAN